MDPRIIARGTPGFSGAELQNLVNQAAIQASREGAKSVNLKHFEWAKVLFFLGLHPAHFLFVAFATLGQDPHGC